MKKKLLRECCMAFRVLWFPRRLEDRGFWIDYEVWTTHEKLTEAVSELDAAQQEFPEESFAIAEWSGDD